MAAFYGAVQEMTVRIAPEIKAEIVRAANEGECSQATVLRQAIRDWAIRRQGEGAQQKVPRERAERLASELRACGMVVGIGSDDDVD